MIDRIGDNSRYRIEEEVLARPVGDSLVLFNAKTERLLTLNACGSRIWQLLSEGRSDHEVLERLMEEFDGPSTQIEREACQFIAELAAEQLIRTD